MAEIVDRVPITMYHDTTDQPGIPCYRPRRSILQCVRTSIRGFASWRRGKVVSIRKGQLPCFPCNQLISWAPSSHKKQQLQLLCHAFHPFFLFLKFLYLFSGVLTFIPSSTSFPSGGVALATYGFMTSHATIDKAPVGAVVSSSATCVFDALAQKYDAAVGQEEWGMGYGLMRWLLMSYVKVSLHHRVVLLPMPGFL